MIFHPERLQSLVLLGQRIQHFLSHPASPENEAFKATVHLAFHKNGWFSEDFVMHALAYWAYALREEKLTEWGKSYDLNHPTQEKTVALILAGNIPLVGFHDVVCVLLTGHKAKIKCASGDAVLIPLLLEELTKITPNARDWFELIPNALTGFDGAIATGSNNSARHFEHYFRNIPHVIRNNKTSIAILDGTETDEELNALMLDVFTYFGLGCRNVTKVFLPKNFDLNRLFAASLPFAHLMQNNKYANNYAYHRTLMMMEGRYVLENDVLLLVENENLFSPVSVLNFGYYNHAEELKITVSTHQNDLQCIVGHGFLPFGSAQQPSLNDYADGIDTVLFLLKLSQTEASK